jgi:hypothetical protein
MCGQEVTLSWYMRKGANWSPASDIVTSYIFTGTGNDQGMASGLGSGWTGFAQQTQSNTVTTSWVRFTHTVTLSATAMQVGINFVTPASVGTAGAADSWDISGIKLELGGAATPFESKGYGEELRACKRYYQRSIQPGTTSYPSSGGYARSHYMFPVEMRTAPTGAFTDLSSGGSSIQTATNPDGFYNTYGSLTASSAGTFSWTMDAEL